MRLTDTDWSAPEKQRDFGWMIESFLETFPYRRGIPTRNALCPTCDGEGTHSNPAIDGNGITESEWADWDYEDREAYISGRYDVRCESCNGNKVIKDIDWLQLNADECEWLHEYCYEYWVGKAEERAKARAFGYY